MASYNVAWKNSVERELRNIDKQYIARIIEVVESLGDNPFPSQVVKLRGAEATYRIRVGDYRIIYQVDSKKKLVIIYHVRHRKVAYRKN